MRSARCFPCGIENLFVSHNADSIRKGKRLRKLVAEVETDKDPEFDSEDNGSEEIFEDMGRSGPIFTGSVSHDRCVCGDEGDPNLYATYFPLTKPFRFTKPSTENLWTWCENIASDKRSLARLMSIMKILQE
ncbi:hypothetical protein AVEN_169146-1 [Araneus ventricosus]|uniref:Uncharacterized protein n=1 Tax=Araneus ventricosus TaxID=182803 RepID=A0A4Y2VJS3_ARAVE|nr:hypothetical protein AVEN_140377-1 [Araneus ventricosus]GBO24688.1 hypothetical protein AVEN_169146-1 [Araneus ventricosus]